MTTIIPHFLASIALRFHVDLFSISIGNRSVNQSTQTPHNDLLLYFLGLMVRYAERRGTHAG